MRRLMVFGSLAGLWLSGCAQPVPDSSGVGSAAGVGFGDYAAFELERARREAQLTGAAPGTVAGYPAPLGALPPSAAAPYGAAPSGISAGDLAAVGIGAAPPPVTSGPIGGGVPAAIVGATPVPGSLPGALPPAVTVPPSEVPPAAPLAASSGFAPAAPLAAPGGIEVAAASAGAAIYGEGRLGAAEIAPGALPATSAARPEWSPQADPLRDTGLEAQPGNAAPVLVGAPAVAPAADAGPNVVAYALSAPNQVGQEWYSRFAFAGEGRMQRNCADYRSADEAQSDFLARGGPERDARGLDPDGDGFACSWDPAPFRAAVNG